ncbi:unnamed protein product [marine sediment metagenome]|uniref:MFS transporter n=1 Tax=marine sediment metagenome TaxID=412755 RepID=X1J644_9ZZZZ
MKLKRLHYGWLMVIIAACIMAVHAFAWYIFGIFLVPLTAEFNWERGAVSGAFSMFVKHLLS